MNHFTPPLAKFLHFGICCAFGMLTTSAFAQTPAPSPPSSPTGASPDNARALLQLVRVQNACKLPLDLKVEKATIEDVVARVKKTFSASPDAFIKKLPIEVRDVRPVRLSFALKNSNVEKTLGSTATIAGAKLWTFADHLLIAPDSTLTPDERDKVDQGKTGQWSSSSAFHGRQDEEKRKEFSAFIASELGGGPVTASAVENKDFLGVFAINANQLTARGDFSRLSPEAQTMLQELVGMSKETFKEVIFSNPSGARSNFDLSTAVVGLDPKNNNWLTTLFSDGSFLSWALSGNALGFTGASPSKPKAPAAKTSPNPKPFIDPSAGNS